eukprot:360894-Chlamydomonas_euryale.AAC.3
MHAQGVTAAYAIFSRLRNLSYIRTYAQSALGAMTAPRMQPAQGDQPIGSAAAEQRAAMERLHRCS